MKKLIVLATLVAAVFTVPASAGAVSKDNRNGGFYEKITYINVGGANPIAISDWRSEITFVNSGCGSHKFKVNGGTQFSTATICPTGGTVSVAGAHPSSNYAAGNTYTNHWSATSGWSPGTGNATVVV